jgi:hypothetical protein
MGLLDHFAGILGLGQERVPKPDTPLVQLGGTAHLKWPPFCSASISGAMSLTTMLKPTETCPSALSTPRSVSEMNSARADAENKFNAIQGQQ